MKLCALCQDKLRASVVIFDIGVVFEKIGQC